MKKILIFLSLSILLLSLFGCKGDYEPVESTKEESEVIFTLELDGERYDIKYELYRALFLNNKTSVDGGDETVWQGEGAQEYINKINGIIISSAADIYGAIHTAEKLGYDAYSKDADKKVKEYITISIEGNGADVIGYESYDKYLEALKDRNLNYSVSDLLIRYSLALEAINDYYLGKEDQALGNLPGEISITEADVRNYYYSDDCSRVLRAFVGEGVKTREQIVALHSQIKNAQSDISVALLIIQNTAATAADLLDENDEISGIVVGRHELDEIYYSDYISEAFRIKAGETSDVIEISAINDGISDGYYILYGIEKDDGHLEKYYEAIKSSYLGNEIGRVLKNTAAGLTESIKFTSKYDTITHSDISMEQ